MSNKSSRAERRRSSVEHKRMDAPSTPGRPLFNFSVGKKSIPSKWDDAEKWLVSASEEKVSSFHMEFHGATSEVFLKDKFSENVEPGNLPHFLHCHRTREGYLFRSPLCDETKQFHAVGAGHRRDVGTTMTSLGNSTTSRWRHSPIKNSSPPRHNTPADRSGALVNFNNNIDISELDLRAHPFDSVVANWSSREEEEDDVSKSLRHFEADGERTKSCMRYQREEARIQAWVNLQKAKAEARSRKLEVKIQKMRSDLDEKLMKRMAVVHRRAEEWRASAQLQHSQQVLRASEQAQKMKIQQSIHFKDHSSCGCFPCNNHL